MGNCCGTAQVDLAAPSNPFRLQSSQIKQSKAAQAVAPGTPGVLGQCCRSGRLARRDERLPRFLGPSGPSATLVEHQEGQQAARDDCDFTGATVRGAAAPGQVNRPITSRRRGRAAHRPAGRRGAAGRPGRRQPRQAARPDRQRPAGLPGLCGCGSKSGATCPGRLSGAADPEPAGAVPDYRVASRLTGRQRPLA